MDLPGRSFIVPRFCWFPVKAAQKSFLSEKQRKIQAKIHCPLSIATPSTFLPIDSSEIQVRAPRVHVLKALPTNNAMTFAYTRSVFSATSSKVQVRTPRVLVLKLFSWHQLLLWVYFCVAFVGCQLTGDQLRHPWTKLSYQASQASDDSRQQPDRQIRACQTQSACPGLSSRDTPQAESSGTTSRPSSSS